MSTVYTLYSHRVGRLTKLLEQWVMGTGQYRVEWVADLNSGTRALETGLLKGWDGWVFFKSWQSTGVVISHKGRRSTRYHGPSKEAWIATNRMDGHHGWTPKEKQWDCLSVYYYYTTGKLGYSPQGCVRCYSAHVLLFSYLLLLLHCTNRSVVRRGPDGQCRVCTDWVRSYIALRVESSQQESMMCGDQNCDDVRQKLTEWKLKTPILQISEFLFYY